MLPIGYHILLPPQYLKHWSRFYHHSFVFSRMSHKWDHTVHIILASFTQRCQWTFKDWFLLLSHWDLSKLLSVSITYSFSLLSTIPLYGSTTVYQFTIYSPVEGYLSCFQFRVIMNRSTINIHVQVLYKHIKW